MSRAKRAGIEEIRGLLGLAHRARGLAIGSREARTGMRRGEVHLILLSEDSSARDRERLRRVAEEERVETRDVGSAEELGAAIGRGAVGVLGIRDRHLATGILRRLEEDTTRTGGGPVQPGGD
jgi:ribosomal protein L7Ae-like RNA K-turn-binding protein